MDIEEREAQRLFFMPPQERRRQALANPDAPNARVMLATDAAGEGLNIQFAWVMVNYDIPWNPARLEQRMGGDFIGSGRRMRKSVFLIL